MNAYDAIIVGAGPAGSVCAAILARGGRRVLLLEKTPFPRHKVCGDCLNPAVWPIIDRLGLRDRLRAIAHAAVRQVDFVGIDGQSLAFPVAASDNEEIVVKREHLDALLVAHAVESGVEFRDGTAVLSVQPGWAVDTTAGSFTAPVLLAADGRNSTIARALNRLGRSRRERVAIQCHAPRPADFGNTVSMFFHPGGYGGVARVNAHEINLCLVADAQRLAELRQFAETRFGLGPETTWHSIAPLSRDDAATTAANGCFLLGDAARVVEPFTGEGIFYALRSGELAANALLNLPLPAAEAAYRRDHRDMYRGRLWINRVAQLAALNPRVTSAALRLFRFWPAPLGLLTAKVVTGRHPVQT